MGDKVTISKQKTLFDIADSDDSKYSNNISGPVYKPRGKKPHIMTLCNDYKTKQLIRDINESALPEDEKEFLRAAAHRHAVFHHENIADYYAHATPEMQQFMERSALVIIDFGSAIESGFVKVCDDIRKQFLTEYGGSDDAS